MHSRNRCHDPVRLYRKRGDGRRHSGAARAAADRQAALGIGVGQAMSAFWTTRDAAGQPRGVTVALGTALAQKLGVPLELKKPDNSSGEVRRSRCCRRMGSRSCPSMRAAEEGRVRPKLLPVHQHPARPRRLADPDAGGGRPPRHPRRRRDQYDDHPHRRAHVQGGAGRRRRLDGRGRRLAARRQGECDRLRPRSARGPAAEAARCGSSTAISTQPVPLSPCRRRSRPRLPMSSPSSRSQRRRAWCARRSTTTASPARSHRRGVMRAVPRSFSIG